MPSESGGAVTVTVTQLTIASTDGHPLGATIFGDVHADILVVVGAATAVPARFYQRFATHLAERGIAVVTFDYRGIGRSRPSDLRGFDASFDIWADRDLAAVVAWALDHPERRGDPGKRVGVVGHSFGGQAFGLLERANETLGLHAFGAGAGWVGHMPLSERPKLLLYWKILGPLANRLLGYHPSNRFGMGEPLPLGVFDQWREWCSRPRYYLDVPGGDYAARVARVTVPIVSVSASDDLWAPETSTRALFSGFTSASVSYRTAPVTTDPIGHLGYFRKAGAPFWDDVVDWFRGRARATRASAT